MLPSFFKTRYNKNNETGLLSSPRGEKFARGGVVALLFGTRGGKGMKKEDGFSLTEIMLALCISAIGFSIAVLFFQMDTNTLTARENILVRQDSAKKMERVQEALSNGFVSQKDVVNGKIVTTPTELKFQTTYFSKDVKKPDFYKISCQGNKVFHELNSSGQKELFNHVKTCGFRYFDSQMNPTSKADEITMVEFEMVRTSEKGENRTVVRRKLMQTM